MAITRINNVLQKHSRWLFGIITIIIIVSFVWFFTPGTSGSIFFSGEQGTGAVAAVVFGEKITVGKIEKILADSVLVAAVQTGTEPKRERFNFSMEDGLNLAIMEAVARKMGIVVSDEKVAEFIRSVPAFQTAGKFDPAKYEAYEKEKLLPCNLNALDVDAAVRRRLSAMEAVSLLGSTPEVSDNELEEFGRNCLQKYSVRTVKFPFAQFKAGIKVTDADLKSHHQANAARFAIPARYQAEIAVFSYADYAKDFVPSSGAIAQYYEANKAMFMKDGKQLSLAQVSKQIAATLKRAEQERLAGKAAAAFREKIYKRTADATGDRAQYVAAFRAVAKEDKTGKRTSIGWFTASGTEQALLKSEPALLASLLSATERTGLTYPVKGNTAYYAGAVTQTEKSRPSKLEEVKELVRASFVDMKAQAAAKEAMREAAAKLALPSADPAKLAEYAKGAKIEKLPPFSVMAPGSTDPYAAGLAAQTGKGKLSSPVDLPDGVFAVFVDAIVQPDAQELAKNKPQLLFFCKYAKQQARQESLGLWLSKNIRNFMMETKEQK